MAVERTGWGAAVGGGVAAAILCVVCFALGGAAARAWLGAAFLVAAVPAGAVGLAMMIRLIPGPWRDSLAGPLDGLGAILPLSALAITPVLLSAARLYPWVGHPLGRGFHDAYLSWPLFAARGGLWLAFLGWLVLRLRSGRGGGRTAIAGLTVYTLFSSLIAIDWLQSLDPAMSSSGFGLYALALQIDLALALAVIAAIRRDVDEKGRDALGAVLLAATAIWAYLGFMQYIIAWTGNLPAGARWFHRRDAWSGLAWLAIALKFGAGVLLVSGRNRRSPRVLGAIAGTIAAGTVPEVAWLVLPAASPDPGAADLGLYLVCAALLALSGLGLFRRFVPPVKAKA